MEENTVGKNPEDGIKAKGVIHWVSATQNVSCDVHLYDRLFTDIAPDAGGKDFMEYINPESLTVVTDCKAEANLAEPRIDLPYQFEREGYFFVDSKSTDKLVFNRTISLRDTWAK